MFSKDQAHQIVTFLNDNEICVASKLLNYSGRGMYGNTCTGVVTDCYIDVVVEGLKELKDECYIDCDNVELGDECEEILTLLNNARTDNFGRDFILY